MMRRRQRGVTLLEIMLSMAVVLVGMAALFRVLSVASRGSQTAQRMTQGLARAQQVLEAIRMQSTSVLECLSSNSALAWIDCEARCRSVRGMGANASPEACVFSSLGAIGQAQDGTRQQYAVLYDANNNTAGSTWVKPGGLGGQSGKVFDVQVVIGWRDDNPTAILPAATACGGPVHCVTLRSSIHRSQSQ